MHVKIDFVRAVAGEGAWRGIGVTLFINWAVNFSMHPRMGFHRLAVPALLASRPDQQLHRRLILLAAAPCTAMVFVWSNLSKASRTSR